MLYSFVTVFSFLPDHQLFNSTETVPKIAKTSTTLLREMSVLL